MLRERMKESRRFYIQIHTQTVASATIFMLNGRYCASFALLLLYIYFDCLRTYLRELLMKMGFRGIIVYLNKQLKRHH